MIKYEEFEKALFDYFNSDSGLPFRRDRIRLGQFLLNRFNLTDPKIFYSEDDEEVVNLFIEQFVTNKEETP